jgi:small-conductance mechanosensitive channel
MRRTPTDPQLAGAPAVILLLDDKKMAVTPETVKKESPNISNTTSKNITIQIKERLHATTNRGQTEKSMANLLKEIDTLIKDLEFGWNPFKRSAQPKINALKELKTQLQTNEKGDKTVEEVINRWLNANKDEITHESIINQHRNKLRSEDRPDVKTSTALKIEGLRRDYGNVKFVKAENEDTPSLMKK